MFHLNNLYSLKLMYFQLSMKMFQSYTQDRYFNQLYFSMCPKHITDIVKLLTMNINLHCNLSSFMCCFRPALMRMFLQYSFSKLMMKSFEYALSMFQQGTCGKGPILEAPGKCQLDKVSMKKNARQNKIQRYSWSS